MLESVDIEKIATALQLLEGEAENTRNFTWHQKLEHYIPINALAIKDLCEISIPISVEVWINCYLLNFTEIFFITTPFSHVCFRFLFFQDIEKIKGVCKPSKFGVGLNKIVDHSAMQALEIPGSEITFKTDTLQSFLISYATKNLMGLDSKDFEVEISLERLVLYEPGGHFNCHCSYFSNESSIFSIV